MLISFSATNFRSIKSKQTIDMRVATKYHKKITKPKKAVDNLENNFFTTKNKGAPELLKTTAIYGSNASGKSNFTAAAYAFNDVAMCFGKKYHERKRSRGELITAYDPFVLDEKSRQKPTEFEIDFITNATRYVYSFSYDKTTIHHEKLEFYISTEKELIYELKSNDKGIQREKFTEHFKGKKDISLDIFKNTKNNLFLTLNVNEDGNSFLNPIHDWIEKKLFIAFDHNNFRGLTLHWIIKDDKNKRNVLR